MPPEPNAVEWVAPKTGAARVALIRSHTIVRAAPICPEIQLHLLRDDSSLWHTRPHIFDEAGPRPYWAFCWASGQAMARHLLDHPGLVRHRRVVDFGSGSGVSAIAAAMAGAANVSAWDIDPLALAAIRLNARLNHVRVRPLQRGLAPGGIADCDVLLAADVFYAEHCHRWMNTVPVPGALVLVSDPGRRGLDPKSWTELERYPARTVPDIEHPSLIKATVYRRHTRDAAVA